MYWIHEISNGLQINFLHYFYLFNFHLSIRMSKSTRKVKPKADIDFEGELWDAANELRGAVAENQYKDFVLSLLFVRHLSERYVERKSELIAAAGDSRSEYYTKSKQELERLL